LILRALADQLGREINPHFFTSDELMRRLSTRDHFLRDVVSKPKLFITGDEHEFTAMVHPSMFRLSHFCLPEIVNLP
jgi:hypothetical protein